MRHQSVAIVVAAMLMVLSSVPVLAQSTTGRLRGNVVDNDGAVLPGVTVTISGETLMGGSRIAVTGGTGAYRFTGLPPGNYTVTAEMESFQPETLENVKVGVGTTADANFVLYLSGFTEAVTVTSEAPLVDVSSSSSGTTFTADFMQDLPTSRNFWDVMTVAPGISSGSVDSSDRLTAFGSDLQSNAWYNDGVEVTGPETGTSWVSMNPDMIEEIQVMGVGAPAEFGNMLGAALNVVTKSGSNEFKGTLNAYWFDNALVDSDINFEESEFSEYEQIEFWDVSATLGGPISKDRLWFFAAYEYWRDGSAFPGEDPSLTPVQYQDRYDLKLSARLSDRHQLDFKGQYNDWGFPGVPDAFRTPSATAGEIGDDTMWALNYQGIFSDRTYMEARYSGWKSNDDNLSQTGSTEPAYIDYNPPGGGPTRYSGGYWYPWLYDTATDQFSVSASHFADDFLQGDHDFKFGVQVMQGESKATNFASATGTYYVHYYYEPYEYYGYIYGGDYYYRVTGPPYYYGAEQEAWGVFVDDSWAVSDRLTLNLGLRFDYARGVIPAYPILNPDGSTSGDNAPSVDPAFTWQNWSPRLGFAYNAGAQRKTVIRGSFGVYYDGNVAGNWDGPPPFTPDFVYDSGPTWDGPWDFQGIWASEALTSNVDPDLEAPRTLQYALGFEHELRGVYSVGAMVVYKDTKNGIGWQFADEGVWEDFAWTDPFTGQTYTLREYSEFPTTRKGNGPGYTVDGFLDNYWGEYTGLVLTFNRRFADWWGLQSSYTYSESDGLNARALDYRQNNPLYNSRTGSHPNQWLNLADGQLQLGDRPHMFRVLANFQLPWKLRANTSFNLQSGRPYTRQARVFYENFSSRQTNFIVEKASDDLRFDFQSLVDFSIGRDWSLPGDGRLKTDLQFFNLLNSTAVDNWQDYVLNEGDRFIPSAWVRPRRLMLRIGVEY